MACPAENLSCNVRDAKRVLSAAKRVVFLTGAGISAASGVPTFRGEGGYWRNRSVIALATPEAFDADPKIVWDWYLMRRQTIAARKPNAAHLAMANWAKAKRISRDIALFTQNVDGLHEAAGQPDVERLHGSLWVNRCTKCGKEREDRALEYAELPLSPCCKALERPGVVWFGERLPRCTMLKATVFVMACEAMVVVGTSGIVSTAADLIVTAHQRGAVVIDVNPEPDMVIADIHVDEPAEVALHLILT